jgi:hypothetical protein
MPPKARARKAPTPDSQLTEYQHFVRYNRDLVRHLPNKQRFAALAKLWKQHKAKHGR